MIILVCSLRLNVTIRDFIVSVTVWAEYFHTWVSRLREPSSYLFSLEIVGTEAWIVIIGAHLCGFSIIDIFK